MVAMFCPSSFEEVGAGVAVVEVSRRSRGDGKEATSRSKPSSGRPGMPSARRVRTMSSRNLRVELTSVSRQNSARPSRLLCMRTRSDAYCALSCTVDGCSRSSAVNRLKAASARLNSSTTLVSRVFCSVCKSGAVGLSRGSPESERTCMVLLCTSSRNISPRRFITMSQPSFS